MTKVGLVQLTSNASVQHNLENLESYFLKAQQEGVSLVVLPENFAFMGLNEHHKCEFAEVHGQGPIQDTIKNLAKKYKLWVIAGTLPLKTVLPHKVKASCLVYDEKGQEVARYDKIHLFDVRVSSTEAHEESKTVERGQNLVVVDTPIGKVGLSVCYDLRFPELYQALCDKGAQIFTVPSAFTKTTGLAHWHVLLRARAIENLAYFLAPNQGGHHENGRDTYGHSMIIDPWGVVLAEAHDKPTLIVGEIKLEHLMNLRQTFPCLTHHVLKNER